MGWKCISEGSGQNSTRTSPKVKWLIKTQMDSRLAHHFLGSSSTDQMLLCVWEVAGVKAGGRPACLAHIS